MDIQKADLFKGLSTEFVKKIMDGAGKESYEKGVFLFRRGEPADYFYMLIDGAVKLSLGETGKVVHNVSRPGQAFGWSSLVERQSYSTSAECTALCNVYRFHVKTLTAAMSADPASGLLFYKRLAGILGDRLLGSYSSIEKKFPGETRI